MRKTRDAPSSVNQSRTTCTSVLHRQEHIVQVSGGGCFKTHVARSHVTKMKMPRTNRRMAVLSSFVLRTTFDADFCRRAHSSSLRFVWLVSFPYSVLRVSFLRLFSSAVGGDDCVPEVRLADFGSAFRQYRQISTARDYTAAYRYIPKGSI